MYARPQTLNEAISVMTGGALLVAGGTDVYPAHAGRPVMRDVVDVSAVAEMRMIRETKDHFVLGGALTWSALIAAPLPPAFDALKQAAREVGSKQIQNRGTLAGNLCNASPAADGIPPLLTLEAVIELASHRGLRRMPLASFVTGYRRTAIARDEILSAILVPRQATSGHSAFVKLGVRRYLVISILTAAANFEVRPDGGIALARVAIGAASPVAVRLPALEKDLRLLRPGTRPSSIIKPHHLEPLSPIGDVRASAAYRLDAALAIIGEALDRAAGVRTA